MGLAGGTHAPSSAVGGGLSGSFRCSGRPRKSPSELGGGGGGGGGADVAGFDDAVRARLVGGSRESESSES